MSSESIRLRSLIEQTQQKNSNRLIQEVNDHCIRLAVNEDSVFDWHFHPNSDEIFMVIEGMLKIEFRDRGDVSLAPGELYKVPAGVIHRTVSKGRTANLCFESSQAETTFV